VSAVPGKPRLLVRADANARMGTGHAMRCLALVQAWQDAGGTASFLIGAGARGVEERLRAEGIDVVRSTAPPGSAADAEEAAHLARARGAGWVVLDGYHFDSRFHEAVRSAGLRLLVIDDNGDADHYHADYVLNQNLHAREELYASRDPHTRFLLGTRYALLRREFACGAAGSPVIRDRARKVLITLGGADPENYTARVLRALGVLEVADLDVVAVIGTVNPHGEAVVAAARALRPGARVEHGVTDMMRLYSWAELAVAAGGTTCWELAFAGVPSLVGVLAANQTRLAESFAAAGAGRNLGLLTDLGEAALAREIGLLLNDPARREAYSRAGQRLVDGRGSARTARLLLGCSQLATVSRG
jgi:UDP-2,4-diacetamido-2,4,6-trideoxy-beta-L-altropyranose hydrolase